MAARNRLSVLVVEDDLQIGELLRHTFEQARFDVDCARTGSLGLARAFTSAPDLIVLDLGLPDQDGLDVCRQLRRNPRTERTPMIMLSARASEADRVAGLEMGADDFVAKPFSPREVLARARALLRRTGGGPESSGPGNIIEREGLSIDTDRLEVTYAGKRVRLTATEFKILRALAEAGGRVLSRTEIGNLVYGGEVAAFDRTIDVHVKAIRRKLGAGGDQVETARGFGYRLRPVDPSHGGGESGGSGDG
jgi:DNA-binding response OmpR family regulator